MPIIHESRVKTDELVQEKNLQRNLTVHIQYRILAETQRKTDIQRSAHRFEKHHGGQLIQSLYTVV